MPRDGGFLREVAARDKLGSQQAGDLYLPVLGAGRHLRRFRVRHSREPKFSTEGKDNLSTTRRAALQQLLSRCSCSSKHRVQNRRRRHAYQKQNK
ncbi:unnamed protein product, partial [Pelagomonas calceolata]